VECGISEESSILTRFAELEIEDLKLLKERIMKKVTQLILWYRSTELVIDEKTGILLNTTFLTVQVSL
jgi:hypothetical protein